MWVVCRRFVNLGPVGPHEGLSLTPASKHAGAAPEGW